MKNIFSLLILCSLAFSGCTEANLGYVADPSLPGECRAGREVTENYDSFEQSDLLDILFVVDASGESDAMLKLLRQGIPFFLETLEAKEVHVRTAVATTSKNSKIQKGEGCSAKIVDSLETESWKEAAACNIGQKLIDDEADEPLLVARNLLGDGFWRKRSKRLVIIVGRDDDCSDGGVGGDKPRESCLNAKRLDINDVAKAFSKSVTSPEGITLAVIAGPASEVKDGRPVCNSSIGSVYAANRLQALTAVMGDNAIFQNLCSNDLSLPLNNIAQHMLNLGVTLCASQTMAHEPIRVVDGEDTILPVGKDGFIYLADQSLCKNGALLFDHSSSRALEEVKVTYCAL